MRQTMRMAWVAALVLGATGSAAAQPVSFAFDYSGDGANEGFNDPTLGPQRRTAFQAAANVWAGRLASRYAGETILIHATFDPLGGSSTGATLGQAGGASAFANFGSTSPKYQANTVYVGALANHLNGSDLNGASPEINAQFNSTVDTGTVLGGERFYYGTDGNHGSNIDFMTVAIHEIAHGLGFSASIQQDGTFLNGETLPDAFDRFLYRGSAAQFLTARSSTQRQADITSNDLFFNGTDTDAGNGGSPAKLYAPGTWEPGSSVSHTDDATYPTDVMDHLYPGVQHTPSAIDLGVLSDIGWDITPVPEPTSFALVAAVGALAALRRRKQAVAALAA